MELWKKQKKVLTAFGIFLAFMLLCTLISRSVYASKLPQVSVEVPRRMALNHSVEAEGIVHQGREYAVTALSGLRVRTVYANIGDHVTPETLLFDLDMEDLQKQIQEKELAVKKLQLQIAAMEQNRSLDAQKQQTENARAQEDYAREEEKAGQALERAREDLDDAEDAYDDHKDSSVKLTSEEDRAAAQAAYEEWTEKEETLRQEMEQCKEAYEKAQEEVKRLEEEIAARQEAEGKVSGGQGEADAVEKASGQQEEPNPGKNTSGQQEEPGTGEKASGQQEEPNTGERTSDSQEESDTDKETSGQQEDADTGEVVPDQQGQPDSGQPEHAEGTDSAPQNHSVAKEPSAGSSDPAAGPDISVLSGQLEAAREAEAKAKEAYENAVSAYESHTAHPVEKPDFSGEDAQQSAWEEKKDILKDAVETAERAVEDAQRAQSDSMLDAGRKVADSQLPSSADSSLEVSRLELAAMQTELEAYKKVQDASGQVYPEAEGIVTRIQVSPGERAGDGAAVVYADLSSPMQFQASITREQKKYVNQGDITELKLGSSSAKDLAVDYVAENEMNPELYDIRIFLPDGTGTIGQSGSFRVEAQSETFSCCIPLNALHEDASQRKYVYIVSERSGILGTEMTAEQVYVKVLDQNDSYAAIEEGVINRETELIVSATETLEDRDVIRYKE